MVLPSAARLIIPKLYNGKDKTFFFFNFEQFRETQIINNVPITVPTAAYRTGNFSGAIIADGNKNLGTDVLGRPMFAGEIYDPDHSADGYSRRKELRCRGSVHEQYDSGEHAGSGCIEGSSAHPAAQIGTAINNLIPGL